MAMETRLSLKQTQRLVMTPLLQQAIRLLQLSTLELQEVVERELVENPLLEELPEEPEALPGTGPSPEPSSTTTNEQPGEGSKIDGGISIDELPFNWFSPFGDFDEPSLVQQEEREEIPFENLVGSTPSLSDYLLDQLRLSGSPTRQRQIGEVIVANIDDDGYLRMSIEELAEQTGASPYECREALAFLQTFDPPGVGARDVRECILLQLQSQADPDPVAIQIAEQNIAELERRRYQDIARAIKVPVERVVEAVETIAALEPKPGRRFASSDTRYITPDVFVYKMGDDYTIVLNDEGLPRLRINPFYRGMVARNPEPGSEVRQYVEQKLRSAMWLIKSVYQRQRTLYKVTESIVKFQRGFLDRGLSALRPLALKDVAEDIGMHESTVSRVTTNKYVQTPQGLFELKFFFHSGLAAEHGEMVSSVSVKNMIRDMIAAESQNHPLSDQEVARKLKDRGVTIARRTVAKYREEIKIPPSHQRVWFRKGRFEKRGQP